MTDEPDAPLDLDMLMTLDPLKLGKQDIDVIIQYHRNIRAAREAGKGRAAARAVGNAPKPKGIAELLASKKPVTTVGRRGF